MSDRFRLLDVNVLIALSRSRHIHHSAAHTWLAALPEGTRFATCPLTECSFLRLSMQPAVTGGSNSWPEAVQLLERIRSAPEHRFLADPTSLACPAISLTPVRGHRQVTDFHLVNLAAACDAVLVTLDRRLPESLVPADRHLVEVIPAV